MKKTLIIALGILMCASVASAQFGGRISLYSDPGYSDCNLNETLFVQNPIYIVHDLAATGNTADFKAVVTWGALNGGVTWNNNLQLGDITGTGISVTYVGCKNLPYLLGTWNWIPTVATPACTYALTVVPAPYIASGEIEIVTCDFQIEYAIGGQLTVNGNPTDCDCLAPGTEETSWSKIKSLYK